MYSDGIEVLKNSMPSHSYELLVDAKEKGNILDLSKYGDAAIMHFRLLTKTNEECFAECDGGVLDRICNVAAESVSSEDFWSKLSTKRYTDAKLRRAVLFAMCTVSKDDVFLPSLPS